MTGDYAPNRSKARFENSWSLLYQFEMNNFLLIQALIIDDVLQFIDDINYFVMIIGRNKEACKTIAN